MSNKMLAVVVCALILGIMALSPPDKPSRREQVQSQMIAQAREEWERAAGLCLMPVSSLRIRNCLQKEMNNETDDFTLCLVSNKFGY